MRKAIKQFSVLGFAAILGTIILGVICSCLLVKSTGNKDRQAIQLTCDNYAEKINDDFQKLSNAIDVVGQSIEVQISDPTMLSDSEYCEAISYDIKQESTDYLLGINGGYTAFLRFSPDFSNSSTAGFYIKEEDGEVNDIEVTDLSQYEKTDYQHVGWYYLPINGKQAEWLELYQIEDSKDNKIAYVYPLFSGENPIGVYGVEVDISYLAPQLQAISDAYGAAVCIEDKSGKDLKGLNCGILYEKSLVFESKLDNGMVLKMTVPKSKVYSLGNSSLFKGILTLYAIIFVGFIFSVFVIGIRPYRKDKGILRNNLRYVRGGIGFLTLLVFIAQVGYMAVSCSYSNVSDSFSIEASNSFTKTVTVGYLEDFAPYTYKEDGIETGYCIELMNELANRLGYNVDYQSFDKDKIDQAIMDEDIDLFLGYELIEADPEMDITDSIVDDSYVIYGKENISGIADVKNSKLVATDSIGDNDVYNLLNTADVVDNQYEEMADLEKGDYEYAVARKSIADMIISQKQYTDVVQVYDLFESPLCIASMDSELISDINEVLAVVGEDGTLDDIYQKWIGNNTKRSLVEIIQDNSEFFSVTGVMIIFLLAGLLVLNITGRKTEELIKKSETDALTHINNRGGGETKIRDLLDKNIPGMFCLLDIDKFKQINDNYGHDVGDMALKAVADCLINTFRDRDIIMRLGGDEFAVYAPFVPNQEVGEKIIGRLFADIEKINLPQLKDRGLTISLGATFFEPDTGDDFEKLYKRADEKTYLSKGKEGNYFFFGYM